MIDQTISFDRLTQGMARCVREWILPHVTDAMARIQAEQLIVLLESLPRVVSPAAYEIIREDNEDARALLERLGRAIQIEGSASDSLEALLAENAALKRAMEQLADELRRSTDAGAPDRLRELQQFFVRSIQRELKGTGASQDFQTLTSREKGQE